MGPPLMTPPTGPELPPETGPGLGFWLFVALFVVLTMPWWCRPSW